MPLFHITAYLNVGPDEFAGLKPGLQYKRRFDDVVSRSCDWLARHDTVYSRRCGPGCARVACGTHGGNAAGHDAATAPTPSPILLSLGVVLFTVKTVTGFGLAR
jgi:hypothetical protein